LSFTDKYEDYFLLNEELCINNDPLYNYLRRAPCGCLRGADIEVEGRREGWTVNEREPVATD
jgi:hypothetical protein